MSNRIQATKGTPIARKPKPRLNQTHEIRQRKTARNNIKLLQRNKLDMIDDQFSGKFSISMRSLGISHPGIHTKAYNEQEDDVEEYFDDTIKVPLYVLKDSTQTLTALDEAFLNESLTEIFPRASERGRTLQEEKEELDALVATGSVKVCAILPRNIISINTAEKSETIHGSDVLVPDTGITMNFTIDRMPLTSWSGTVSDVFFMGKRHSGRRMVFITMDNLMGAWTTGNRNW